MGFVSKYKIYDFKDVVTVCEILNISVKMWFFSVFFVTLTEVNGMRRSFITTKSYLLPAIIIYIWNNNKNNNLMGDINRHIFILLS